MKPLKSKHAVFCGLLILSGVFYLVDCLVVSIFDSHSDLPWIEKGDLRRQPGWYPDNRLLPAGRLLDSHFWRRQVKAITRVEAIDLLNC